MFQQYSYKNREFQNSQIYSLQHIEQPKLRLINVLIEPEQHRRDQSSLFQFPLLVASARQHQQGICILAAEQFAADLVASAVGSRVSLVVRPLEDDSREFRPRVQYVFGR